MHEINALIVDKEELQLQIYDMVHTRDTYQKMFNIGLLIW